jgi:hypothetical protein
MKYIKKYLSLALLCCFIVNISAGCGESPISTTMVGMTFGQNLYTQYHKLIFPEELIYADGTSCNSLCNLAFDSSITYRYMQSRNSNQIAENLWGSNKLLFQGSSVPNRANDGLIAEYFGMGPDTNGYIALCPSLKNQVIDFQFAVSGLKLWAQINFPLAYAKWSLTPYCGGPSMQGIYGNENLDGAEIILNYLPSGVATIAGQSSSGTDYFFLGSDATNVNNSFIDAISAGNFINVGVDNPQIDDITVTSTIGGPIENSASRLIGHINMGIYGDFSAEGIEVDSGSTSAVFKTNEVFSAPDQIAALGGYTFGLLKNRNNNLFNFNLPGTWRLADIPIMIGYDFCKSDANHLGMYLKFVIPTGTKIDQSLLQYVLNPIIGNGRHFELGLGISAHMNVWACDSYSFGIFSDGYIDYMFGTSQTRTFDLKNQPMSRYTLVYELEGNQFDGYSVGNNMSAVGDINIYEGNVSGYRGEFLIDCIWKFQNWELGLGYEFVGQSKEKIQYNIIPKGEKSYSYVGNILQNSFGVNVTDKNLTSAKIDFKAYDQTTKYPTVNFFNLGNIGEVATINSNQNSIYSYGEGADIASANFLLPDVKNNCSGLMSGQILNKLFCHIDYVWADYKWQPAIGILGSIGFVPSGYPTPNYWDLGMRIGLAF